jgi:hypothetical protein
MCTQPRPDHRPEAAASRRRAWTGAALVAVAAGALAALASCNILGPAAYFALGQPKADALYEPVDRPTVVFVDDRHNVIPMNATRIRREIADKVSTDLMEQEVLTQVISSRDAMAMARNQDREGRLMSIEAIGETVGAEQVIYVEMVSFQGSPDGYSPRPTAACRLKVVDVPNRERLFPGPDADQPWQPVAIVSPPISPDLYASDEGRRQIESVLAVLIGDQIAKLFYAHVPDEIGTRLDPQ